MFTFDDFRHFGEESFDSSWYEQLADSVRETWCGQTICWNQRCWVQHGGGGLEIWLCIPSKRKGTLFHNLNMPFSCLYMPCHHMKWPHLFNLLYIWHTFLVRTFYWTIFKIKPVSVLDNSFSSILFCSFVKLTVTPATFTSPSDLWWRLLKHAAFRCEPLLSLRSDMPRWDGRWIWVMVQQQSGH